MKSTETSKEAIGYIMNDKKAFMESGDAINLEDMYFLDFVKKNERPLYHYNNEVQHSYVVTDIHPL